jgi:exodeoxyribonuclease VII small subunit
MSAPAPEPVKGIPTATEREAGFDERLERLDGIVRELEEGGLGLEQSIERYREGVALLASCRALLERYRAQVEVLGREADAGPGGCGPEPDAGA